MKKYLPIDDDKSETVGKIKVKLINVDNATKVQRYFFNKERFHQIDKNLLSSFQEVNFSIFIKKDFDFQPILNATEQLPQKISSGMFDIDGDVFIQASDIKLYTKYLESLHKTDLPDKSKSLLIKENAKIAIRDIFAEPEKEDNIKKASSAVEKISDSIIDEKNVLYDLISKINHDYYLYTHSVNVAVLSIGLGMSIGLSSSDIFFLGTGAILHDIGKSSLPPYILHKPQRLTPGEFKIMKNHVFEGLRILSRHECFPKESISAIAQHHEKLSGEGYPLGLKASDITLYGKITAIADCYDALTTQNPYKYSYSPFSALNILVKETEHYERELLEIFIKMLGRIEQSNKI